MCIYSITNYYGRFGNNVIQICSTFIQGYDNANKYTLINHPIFKFKNILYDVDSICKCNTIKLYNVEQLKQYDLSRLKICYKKHFIKSTKQFFIIIFLFLNVNISIYILNIYFY